MGKGKQHSQRLRKLALNLLAQIAAELNLFEAEFDEHGDGKCTVQCREKAVDLESTLLSLGFAPDSLDDAITRINLDQSLEGKDSAGTPVVLWHDPRQRRIKLKRANAAPAIADLSLASIFCPECTAVLIAGKSGQLQTCPNCGHTISTT
jgi:hypothetical protein